jgi:hypothetical protein
LLGSSLVFLLNTIAGESGKTRFNSLLLINGRATGVVYFYVEIKY